MGKEARADLSELDLIREIRDGDHYLFEELISAYQNRLGAFIFRLIGEEDEVKDLVQETFIRAYKSLKSFKGKSAFSTWLFRIGYNLCIDSLKKRQKNHKLNEDLAKAEPLVTRNGAETMEDKQLHALINQVITDLPEKYRTVLHLFYKETRNYSQIARITNVPVNSVKSLLFRGKKLVKDRLVKNYKIEVLQG